MLGRLLQDQLYFLFLVIFLLIIIVSSLFYKQHVQQEIRAQEARTQQILQQLENKKTTLQNDKTTDAESVAQTESSVEIEDPDNTPNFHENSAELAELPIDDIDTFLDIDKEGNADETDEPGNSADAQAIEEIVQLINAQFEIAGEIRYEEEEVKNRGQPVQLSNGQRGFIRSEEDKARLEELKYELHDALSTIGEMVPGAIIVKLVYPTGGSVKLTQYYNPHIFEEVLGKVPEGYHKYIDEFLPQLKQ